MNKSSMLRKASIKKTPTKKEVIRIAHSWNVTES